VETRILAKQRRIAAVAIGFFWLLTVQSQTAHAEAWVPVAHSELDIVFEALDAKAALVGYSSVVIDPLSVWYALEGSDEFESREDLDTFGSIYVEAMERELRARGFAVVAAPGPGVLRLHFEIVDFLIHPYSAEQLRWADRFGFPTAGDSLTLVGEFSDSVDGTVLVRMADLGLPGNGTDPWRQVDASFDNWAKLTSGMLGKASPSELVASRAD
jgi:hypothetical protein